MPLPLDNPEGFTIQMFLLPLILYCGSVFYDSLSKYFIYKLNIYFNIKKFKFILYKIYRFK